MSVLLLIPSALLSVVFAAAGVGKLLDRQGSLEATRAFGVPSPVASVVAVALPVAEIGVALLLLPASTRWVGALGVLGLLLAFCAAIGRAMARGKTPECRCFGQLHSAPVGWKTLARNGVLAGLALTVAVAGRDDPGPGAFGWLSRLDAGGWAVLALTIVVVATVALAGAAITHVLRAYGRVLVRLERVEEQLRSVGLQVDDPDDVPQRGLAPGTEAPGFALDSLAGEHVDLDALLEPGRPLLLLFTSPTCGPCSLLMPSVARWQREYGGALTVALLSHGDEAATRAEAAEHALEHVLLDRDGAAYDAYGANGTPSAVLVDPDRRIASWLAAGSDWIESLVERAVEGGEPGLAIGAPVPALPARLLDGDEVDLTSLVERETVVLFWNPSCGFCRAMHDDLRAWEQQRRTASRGLLVVSAGAAGDVQAEGFSSAVLLDPEWSIAEALGAAGTPMALLVDEGRVASPLVSGAQAVLDLLGAGTLTAA